MISKLVEDLKISSGICLKIKAENETETILLNRIFGKVNQMGDIDFATIEEESQIKEVILYNLKQ